MSTITSTFALEDKISAPLNDVYNSLMQFSEVLKEISESPFTETMEKFSISTEMFNEKTLGLTENIDSLDTVLKANSDTFSNNETAVNALSDEMNSFDNNLSDAHTSITTFDSQLNEASLTMESFGSETSDTSREVEDLGSSIQDTASSAERTQNPFDGWKSTVIALNQALELSNRIIGRINATLSTSLDAGREQLLVEQRLAVVLANNAESQEEFLHNYQEMERIANEMEGKTTIPAGAWMTAQAELATYITEVEALEALMETMGNYAVGMAGDIALSNAEMEKYATQLGMALEGNLMGLRQKGFEMTDAQRAIIETGTEMERVAVLTEIIDESWGDLAETIANTPAGQINAFNTALANMHGEIGKRLIPIWGELATVATMALVHIENAIHTFIDFLIENIDAIIIALTLLGTVAVFWGIKTMIAWWPVIKVMLIVIGVILVLTMIFSALGITAGEVIYFIGTAFIMLAELIINGVIIPLYNSFLMFAEFLGNLFYEPLDAILQLFTNVFTAILGMISSTAAALGRLFGKDWGGLTADLAASIDDAAAEMVGENYFHLDRMEKWDSGAATDSLANFTTGLDSSLANLSDLGSGMQDLSGAAALAGGGGVPDVMPISFPPGSTSGGGGGSSGGGSGGRGGALKVEEQGDVFSQDDIKLLRDIATKDYRLNFQQVTPQVSLSFTGDIRETADVTNIAHEVTDIISKAVETHYNNDLTEVIV